MIETEAWALPRGPVERKPGQLQLEKIRFADITSEELLVQPLYGCWEGNMAHALLRDPIDICRHRGEERVVLGNAGVVRVLHVGSNVHAFHEGDVCGIVSGGQWDPAGYPRTILGYDEPGSMGVLAKRIKVRADQLFLIPSDTRHSFASWAAFTVRYVTAWDNWKIALGAWRLQMSHSTQPLHAWGWGGGVALGELLLARSIGAHTVMICGSEERLDLARHLGLGVVDRRDFADLQFDAARFKSDLAFRRRYTATELRFLEEVRRRTDGLGVSIFIDNIGQPVYRATLKALGRQGVIATSGWKHGMHLDVSRGTECISRHLHVFTHGSRNTTEAVDYAEANSWLPPLDGHIYEWDAIGTLAEQFSAGVIDSYFPVFRVNPE